MASGDAFEIQTLGAKKLPDLFSKFGAPYHVVLAMGTRDEFIQTLAAFERYEAWDAAGKEWTTTHRFLHSEGQTGADGATRTPARVESMPGAEVVFCEPVRVPPGPAKLKRVHADSTLAFQKRGWVYTFRCTWSAATLSPGIESLIEQRAAPSEYAVLIGRPDWDAYVAGHTSEHVAESIAMKVRAVRDVIT